MTGATSASHETKVGERRHKSRHSEFGHGREMIQPAPDRTGVSLPLQISAFSLSQHST
jgi:hypothetical protein